MFYIGADPYNGQVFAGKIKQVQGDEYEWEEREDCTSSFFESLFTIVGSDGTMVVNSNNKPKYKIAITELTEEEIKDLEAKTAARLAKEAEEKAKSTEAEKKEE